MIHQDKEGNRITSKDSYTTRVKGGGQILPRLEPVVFDHEGDRPSALPDEQLEAYAKDGYLFRDAFFSEPEVKAFLLEAESLRTSERVRQSELSLTDPTSGESRAIFGVDTVSELFSKLARDVRILEIVRQILGSEVYLHQSRVNFAPGFRGEGEYWHSDFETWHAEDGMPQMRAICCEINLDPTHAYSGPTMLIPGSHKFFCQCSSATTEDYHQQALRKQDDGLPSEEQLRWLTEQSGIMPITGVAGSLLLYDCNLVHGAVSNMTPFPQNGIFFAYNSVENPLSAPYAAPYERPWFMGNRKPDVLEPLDLRAELLNVSN